jgi:hypothetical protein
MKNGFALLILFFVLSFQITFAQVPLFDFPTQNNAFSETTGIPTGIIEQLSVEILPKVPAPGERVNISITSFSSDLTKGYFVWRVNGSNQLEGRGETNFNFTAPRNGSSTTVSVSITKEDGEVLNRSFDFAPAEVDIIYEAQTYTPPFYKGKALFTSESSVRLIALPTFINSSGTRVPAENLSYVWSINGTVDQSQSGYGKNVYQGTAGLVQRPLNVSVEVSAANSNLKARGALFLNYSEPEVVIYENNPLLGVVFEKSISGNFTLKRPEIELQAIPYYFSTPQKNSAFVDYRWKMNGNNLVTSGDSFVNFRNDTGEEGQAVISLETEHFNKILQLTSSVINLSFEKNDNVFENNFEF